MLRFSLLPSRWSRTVVQPLFACLPEWLLINYDTSANTSFWHTNNSQGPPSTGHTEVVVENDEIFQPPFPPYPKKKDKKKIPPQKKTFIVLAVDVVGPIINLSLACQANLDADLVDCELQSYDVFQQTTRQQLIIFHRKPWPLSGRST